MHCIQLITALDKCTLHNKPTIIELMQSEKNKTNNFLMTDTVKRWATMQCKFQKETH